jgi:hypothetical protein
MKNKLKLSVAMICFLFQTVLFSALPPLFQNIAEIKAILIDKRLGQLLESGESIEEIKKVDDGYLIITNQHKLLAKVIYKPISRPGPAQFDIDFETQKHVEE